MIKINSFGKTDVGLVRKNNEDALILKPELGFWAVADGMGGEERGEVASQRSLSIQPWRLFLGILRPI